MEQDVLGPRRSLAFSSGFFWGDAALVDPLDPESDVVIFGRNGPGWHDPLFPYLNYYKYGDPLRSFVGAERLTVSVASVRKKRFDTGNVLTSRNAMTRVSDSTFFIAVENMLYYLPDSSAYTSGSYFARFSSSGEVLWETKQAVISPEGEPLESFYSDPIVSPTGELLVSVAV